MTTQATDEVIREHNAKMERFAELIDAYAAGRIDKAEYTAARDQIMETEQARKPHTIGGQPISAENPGTYGRTHDMSCPGCEGTSFLSSPRSETYWAS